MDKHRLYECWAPAGALWSDWAKPVLFAHWLGSDPVPLSGPFPEVTWAPPADGKTALVLDVPGPQGVLLGLALAAIGYRPVPLYNACPPPPLAQGLVDVHSTLAALAACARPLAELHLPNDAPPAFLLDANRRFGAAPATPGAFDNRSVCFPTDFPSANFLLAHGIQRITLVQLLPDQPQQDLAHTLRLWQQAGLVLEVRSLADLSHARALRVRRPSLFGWVVYRFLMMLRLRPNPLGGFGGVLSDPSAG